MRNRYLDLLRAAAIVRVIVYHLFGWPWLSILLPAMGIMFALAGSLTAASLDRRSAGDVITSRLRRLLPPLWALAIIAVPAMLYLGWTNEDGGDEPWSWKLGLWILPIGDPPGSERGIDVWEPLWYVRAYLWFVVLSPLMYLAYKKIGWAAVPAPIILIAFLDKSGFSLPFGRADAAMWDFATYGACWIAGFAHHDGRLARLRPVVVLGMSTVMGCAALYWLRGHAGEGGYDLNDVSESQALWSLAFVLLALRWQPDMSWLAKNRVLDGAVDFLNARAVTIYLWHNIAIAAIWPVLTLLALDDLDILDGPVDLVASMALTMLAVLALGWVEDVAARRRPALWPAAGRRKAAADPPPDPAPRSGRTRSNGFGVEPASVAAAAGPGRDAETAGTPRAHRRGYAPAQAAGEPDLPAGGGFESPPVVPARGVPSAPAGYRDEQDQVAPWSAPGGNGYGTGRQPVAPYPEAAVSFGPPEDGPRLRRQDAGHPDITPRGPAAPEQSRGHDDEPAAATSWFGGDSDEGR
ncbi:acyltransferase family protein [Actinoplanes sp. NPDC049118]|uniref:acyltransferase family protein n=1 Tax=Actinoplanes sp. NPDC049118 TaxID=3155769 RepID=UPI0033D85E54